MKYIDVVRLKAEIERLKDQLIRGACAAQIEMETNCKDEAYNEVLAFLDSLQQEQPSFPGDLDEAAEEYMKKARKHLFDDSPIGRADDAFKAGAEWQKEQMLKDAVEGEIQMRYSGCLCAKTIRAINEDKFKLGDKVRLIVLKAEEE